MQTTLWEILRLQAWCLAAGTEWGKGKAKEHTLPTPLNPKLWSDLGQMTKSSLL